MMQAKVISLSSVSRNDVPSAREDARYEGFCKALVTLKTLMSCNPAELIISVSNLLAAEFVAADEARALAQFYGWDLPQ